MKNKAPVDPEVAAFVKEHFNDQLSDDEDNSWADELSDHAAGLDDYYGEEGGEGEYGDENSPKRGEVHDESTLGGSPDKSVEEEQPAIKVTRKKTVINVFSTEYDVVKKVAKKVNEFKLVEIEEDHEGGVHKGVGGGKLSQFWDITWHDLAITPDFLSKLEPY